MAKVLILSMVFPPDGVSTAQIMADLAVDLRESGHSVSVITTQPHYNRDLVAEAGQPLTPVWGGLLFRSRYSGIPVLHTRMRPRSENIGGRLGGWVAFHLLAMLASLRYTRAIDVIVVPSPLLSVGALAWFLCALTGARYIYNVQELYPDLAIQLGKIRNRYIIGTLRILERLVYRTAGAITVIASGMVAKVVGRGASPSNVHLIPNFVDENQMRPLARDNAFAREHDLLGRFVVGYAGNMGHAQGLDVLLRAADLLRDQPSVLFVFVGDGVARPRLEAIAKERNLKNVRFIPHQPYSRVPEIYAASEVQVVSLLGTIEADAVPSKAFRIMACERSILAIASRDSELAHMVEEAQCGVFAEADDTIVAHTITGLASSPDRLRESACRGRAYVLAHATRSQITRRYANLVAELAARASSPRLPVIASKRPTT